MGERVPRDGRTVGGVNAADTLPSGPCAGLQTGLGAGASQVASLPITGSSQSLTATLPGAVCGQWVQAIDLGTCQASNLVEL